MAWRTAAVGDRCNKKRIVDVIGRRVWVYLLADRNEVAFRAGDWFEGDGVEYRVDVFSKRVTRCGCSSRRMELIIPTK